MSKIRNKKNRNNTAGQRTRAGHIKDFVIIVLAVLSGTMAFFLYRQSKTKEIHPETVRLSNNSTSFTMIREQPKQLIAPLILANVNVESEQLSGLKADLDMAIRQWETKGRVRSVSVYLRDLNNGNWICVNGSENFMPGSLLKVPIMITWLKQEMEHPGTLRKEYTLSGAGQNLPIQAYEGSSISPNRKYTVAELIRYMITDSDNNSTFLLIQNIDHEGFKRLFTSVGLPPADLLDVNYSISARDFSRFFGMLYNATYLNDELSEYALELLSKSKFRDGLLRELPAGVTVAHKFGEHSVKQVSDFSESGIVYYDSEPYLLTVMTKGDDIREQAKVIGDLSHIVYTKFRQ